MKPPDSPDVVPPGATRVLLALMEEHRTTGRATVRALCERTGLASTSTVHKHLEGLRRRGLVTWEDRKQGTLRPTVSQAPRVMP